MQFYNKIIILLILIFFGFLIFKLMMARRNIYAQYKMEGFHSGIVREGAWFSPPTIDEELAQVNASDIVVGISNIQNIGLSLNQYCIKGSYNTAFTGTYMNNEMIKYVLHRGCRFLDFEVFSFDDIPYVAYSTDPTFETIQSKNKISLRETLSTVATNAFGQKSPNQNDPIFIHLRIKSNNKNLYDKIGTDIDYALNDKLYIDTSTNKAIQIDENTKINTIMGKVLIVIDKTYAPTYKNISGLGNYVSMESASDNLRRYDYKFLSQQQYTSPNIKDDKKNTDVSIIKLVIPNLTPDIIGNVYNSIYYPMVLYYGAQIVLYPFYISDMYLGLYETAFAKGKSAFVPLATMIPILNEMVHPSSSVKPPT